MKTTMLGRVLLSSVKILAKDYEVRKIKFNQRPYFRLLSNLLLDLNAPDPTLDSITMQILVMFSNAFWQLSPLRFPIFAFSWLELISHRMFMPRLLSIKSQRGWPFMHRLLMELFKFLEPYLRSVELNDPLRLLYKGTLRVLLVLLHDFPEFLCDYHYSFCDLIPSTCVQMRNLVLSAFPRNMRLPDPFTPNLKVDLLPEISQPPRILSAPQISNTLSVNNFKQEIDLYLKSRSPMSFLLELRTKLMSNFPVSATSSSSLSQTSTSPSPASSSSSVALVLGNASSSRCNTSLINALVLYVGVQAIAQLQNKTQGAAITNSAAMDIFQQLAMDLDTEGRYLFLNAIANQLRYPNNHTHYFSCVLLYLFVEANPQDIVQEQITRVLLERLIVNRPHPWGLLITFIELIKNPRYNFWNRGFIHCAPDIERLFESVARSCMVGTTPSNSLSVNPSPPPSTKQDEQ